MLTFPREGDESHDVVSVVPLKSTLGVESSSESDTFVLGPGYEAVGNGQVPQALPGQAHDASPPLSQNAPSIPSQFSASATTQSAIEASSPSSSPTAPPSFSASSSAVSASSMSVLPSISALVQSSILPISSSQGVINTTSPPSSVASSPLPSVSAIVPAVAFGSDNGHGASFWAGIALLSIAGTATLITLFAWWLRMRSRKRRHPWESGWRRGRSGTESYKFPEDAISSFGDSTSLWQQLVDRDVGELRRSTSNLLSSYRTAGHRLHLPAPAALNPFMRRPYLTVRPLPLELRHSDTSVPGVMQDIGSLRVANLVSGDMLTSGDESSRPPTALDDVGTPRESSVMLKPRYLSLNGSGLDVPWILTPQSPLQPKANRPPPLPPPRPLNLRLITPLSGNRWKDRLERSSQKPIKSPDSPHSITTGVTRRTGRSLLPTPTRLCQVRSAPPRESLVPPRLPHLPPLPQVPHTNATRSKSTKGQHGSRRLRQLVRGSSSSGSSAMSVGSDMSRSSGGASMARWARLSEREEAARHALRRRRLQSVSSARSRPEFE
jgi:hypothetical protein